MRRVFKPSAESERRRGDAVRALGAACESRDVRALADLLHRDVSLVIDTGGETSVLCDTPKGRPRTLYALWHVLAMSQDDATYTAHPINGQIGLLIRRDETVVGVLTAHVRRRRIRAMWVVTNPDKLKHWNSGPAVTS